MAQGRCALLYAGDTFFVTKKKGFDTIEAVFDAVQAPLDRFETLDEIVKALVTGEYCDNRDQRSGRCADDCSR
jgi:hypothetical protein